MSRWEVKLRYKDSNKKLLEAVAHADGHCGHDAIVAAIDAVKEQVPGAQVVQVQALPLG